MVLTTSKVNFTQVGEFAVISHKELAILLRETADALDQGGFGARHPETTVGKIGEPKHIKVSFDFTEDGEVRSIGVGIK